MTETVKLLEGTDASITIFEAMVAAYPQDSFVDTFKLDPKATETLAQVSMTVNGVEVPVIETLKGFWNQFDDQVTKAATKIANEMVTGAGLRDLVSRIEHSEWEITEALNNFKNSRKAP